MDGLWRIYNHAECLFGWGDTSVPELIRTMTASLTSHTPRDAARNNLRKHFSNKNIHDIHGLKFSRQGIVSEDRIWIPVLFFKIRKCFCHYKLSDMIVEHGATRAKQDTCRFTPASSTMETPCVPNCRSRNRTGALLYSWTQMGFSYTRGFHTHHGIFIHMYY